MGEHILYFSDNFFSAGKTDILNESKDLVGKLDLKSVFSSKIDVLDLNGKITLKGSFQLLGNDWVVKNPEEREIGVLKRKVFSVGKRYMYKSHSNGEYAVIAASFTNEYSILDQQNRKIATFQKVSGFMESPVFKLQNQSTELSNDVLIVIIMGVNMIRNRGKNATSIS